MWQTAQDHEEENEYWEYDSDDWPVDEWDDAAWESWEAWYGVTEDPRSANVSSKARPSQAAAAPVPRPVERLRGKVFDAFTPSGTSTSSTKKVYDDKAKETPAEQRIQDKKETDIKNRQYLQKAKWY